MSSIHPHVSIIVCTHNRRSLLPTCLESLLADTSRVDRELVVIDNASTDGATEFLREFVTQPVPFPVRFFREPMLGLSNARNTGLRVTSGELVLFTDDDVWVDDGWAAAMVEPFEDPHVGAVGGRVLAEWPPDAPAWAKEAPHGLMVPPDLGPESRRIEPPGFVVGASLGLRRAALERFGPAPFNPALGVRGDARFACEEAALVREIASTWDVRYTAEAIVNHPVFPERLERHQLLRWALQEGVSSARADLDAHEWRLPLPHRFARFAVTGGLAGFRRLRRSTELDAESMRRDITAFTWTGRRLEYLLGRRFPSLVDRIAVGRPGRTRASAPIEAQS